MEDKHYSSNVCRDLDNMNKWENTVEIVNFGKNKNNGEQMETIVLQNEAMHHKVLSHEKY